MASISPWMNIPYLFPSTYQPGEQWAPGGALRAGSCWDTRTVSAEQSAADELHPQICAKETQHH